MKLILFSKLLKDMTIDRLAAFGRDVGLDGYDLAVRPGFSVSPDTVSDSLPKAVDVFADHGLSVPMVTGNFDLLTPDHPTAEPILAAMNVAGVRLLKLGYFMLDPAADYWREVDRIRRAFEGWQELSARYDVKICYHTHSNRCMGMNAGMLAHLLRGFDPDRIGAYLDAGHLAIEGEEFDVALAVVRDYMSILGVKDYELFREPVGGHGRKGHRCVPSGDGVVDWTAVFGALNRGGFDVPVTIHIEYDPDDPVTALKREVAFFRSVMRA